MDITHIPARSADGNVHVFVEIPTGSRNKYEYDKDLGLLMLDRTLYSAVHYPTDYGFVPSTCGADGEPLDALLLMEESVFPGCLVLARMIGVLTIEHGSGLPEQKLLGVPVREPRFAEYHDIADVPQHLLKEIEHFFAVFKQLEGKDVGVLGWEGAQEADQVLTAAIRTAQEAR
jgi:inorganic pyrophosphatase